jgi:hypothetical protein
MDLLTSNCMLLGVPTAFHCRDFFEYGSADKVVVAALESLRRTNSWLRYCCSGARGKLDEPPISRLDSDLLAPYQGVFAAMIH